MPLVDRKGTESVLYRQIIFARLCENSEPNEQIQQMTGNDRNFNANWCGHFNCWKYVEKRQFLKILRDVENSRKRKTTDQNLWRKLQTFLFWKIWMRNLYKIPSVIMNLLVGLYQLKFLWFFGLNHPTAVYAILKLFWINIMSVSCWIKNLNVQIMNYFVKI